MNDLAKAATTQFQPGLLYGTPALVIAASLFVFLLVLLSVRTSRTDT